MATPTGTISLSDVNIELRRSSTAGIDMNDSQVRALARRGSGSISLADLQGKSIVNFAFASDFVTQPFPGTATASFTFFSDASNWSIVSGVGSQYELRATQISASGTATRTGTLNTFLSLGSNITFSISTNTLGFKNWVLSIEIREASGGLVVDTGPLDLSVEVVG
jgi:hypothetical protein